MDELKQLLLEVKSSNKEHDDEVERNDIPMDVNIDMEASRNLHLREKHMTKELKDDYSIDDPLLILPSCLVSQLSPLYDPTKRKKLRKEIEKPLTSFDPLRPISRSIRNDILIDYANGLHLFITSNGLMLTLCMSLSMFGLDYIRYDSLMGINNNARLQVAIKPLAKLLPHILNAIAYYGFHGDTKVNYQEWEIERLQDIPQQKMSNGDCGMFVIKYAEYLMHNHTLKSLTSARMDLVSGKDGESYFI
ncbi:hypothetical protein AAG906_004402 [Vitis piasezkii]